MPRMLDNVSAAHRPPRQVKAGLAPGRGAVQGAKGRPAFVATDNQRAEVRKLRACGFTNESISVVMTIPLATLERHFTWELQHGKTMVDAKILGGIVDMAMEGDKTMSIFTLARAVAGSRMATIRTLRPRLCSASTLVTTATNRATPDTRSHRLAAAAGRGAVMPIMLPKQRKVPERIKRPIALRELATLQAADKPRHRMRTKNAWLREPPSQ